MIGKICTSKMVINLMNKLIECYKNVAEEIWHKIDFSNRMGFKFGEVAITSHLLFQLYRYRIDSKDNTIQIFESKKESTSGSDLELYIEVLPKQYLYFVIQSKKLYYRDKKFKYAEISHEVGKHKISQLETLLSYAKSHDAVPLYLFYNYSPRFKNKDKEYYGCSVVLAEYIKENFKKKATRYKWRAIPTFDDLHMVTPIIAQPLYRLGYKSILKIVKKHYPAYTLIEEKDINIDGWIEIKSDVDISTGGVNVYNDDNYEFAPRHRIVQKLDRN